MFRRSFLVSCFLIVVQNYCNNKPETCSRPPNWNITVTCVMSCGVVKIKLKKQTNKHILKEGFSRVSNEQREGEMPPRFTSSLRIVCRSVS